MSTVELMILWCVDLMLPGLEMLCFILMSMRRRVFAIGGAVGAALSTGITKFLALKGATLWLEHLPSALIWLRRFSAVAFLAFSLFLARSAFRVKGDFVKNTFFQWKRLTFWRGFLVGLGVAVVNPAGLVGTLAMVGGVAERGMPFSRCLSVVLFMMITEMLWSLFLIFVVTQRMHFFLQKKVQLSAFIFGSVVFLIYAVRAASNQL